MNIRLKSSQLILVIVVALLNLYVITEGFLIGSFWGITLAVVSLVALVFCLLILKKMQELKEMENEE